MLPPHFFDEIAQTVGLGVQVGMIYLMDIPGKNDLRVLASPGNDGFHLMGGQILGLINNDIHLDQTPASNIGKGLNDQLFVFQQIMDLLVHLALFRELAANDCQVVIERLHIGANF